MSTKIREKLAEYIEKNNEAIGEFERRHNLNKNLARQILEGKIQNPTLETAIKIADAIGCYVDELCDRKNNVTSYMSGKFDTLIDNRQLYLEISNFINLYLEKKSINNIDMTKIFELIHEIYVYCKEKKDKKFDSEFATWLLEKSLLSEE